MHKNEDVKQNYGILPFVVNIGVLLATGSVPGALLQVYMSLTTFINYQAAATDLMTASSDDLVTQAAQLVIDLFLLRKWIRVPAQR